MNEHRLRVDLIDQKQQWAFEVYIVDRWHFFDGDSKFYFFAFYQIVEKCVNKFTPFSD